MTVGGEFGKSGTVETYFISMIEEDGPFVVGERMNLEQGFLVVKLSRHKSDSTKLIYRMLDSMNDCKSAFHAVIDGINNWSEEEKAEFKHKRNIEPEVRSRFYNHVKLMVTKESLSTGICKDAWLDYK
jgi:hypothetical protein